MKAMLVLVASLGSLFFSLPLLSDCLPQDQIKDQYLVRLKKNESSAASVHTQASGFLSGLYNRHVTTSVLYAPVSTGKEDVSTFDLHVLPPTTVSVTVNSDRDLDFIKNHPEVESVEPNCRVQALFTTNDPSFNKQWGLAKIQAPQAWDISRGSKEIIISISDTGVDYLHEDLKDNMWVNKKEIPGNKIDDDNNGCIDDIYGCDFGNNTGDPMPTNSNLLHGSHVAGIAAASGNNGKGVSGVSQNIRIMAAKGFANSGSGSTDALLKTIYYSVDNGARVINCSWGHKGSALAAEKDAMKYAINKGVVVVVAAGNDNIDASGFSPAGIPDVITVAATDASDQIATFSNWGTVVDVAAPGGKGYNSSKQMVDGIFATLPRNDGSYGELIGTSMASPFVAGLAGLILSVNPNLNHYDVLRILKDGGDKVHVTTSGSGKQFDYMRINAFKALQLAKATLGAGGGTGGSGEDGNSCDPSDENCNSLTGEMPSSMKSAFKGNAGASCALIQSSGGGPKGPGSAGALILLPAIVALALRKRFRTRT